MEAKLDSIMDSMMQSDNSVTGVLVSDNQGLSIGSEFQAKTRSYLV